MECVWCLLSCPRRTLGTEVDHVIVTQFFLTVWACPNDRAYDSTQNAVEMKAAILVRIQCSYLDDLVFQLHRK
jgi:hypothetical protein